MPSEPTPTHCQGCVIEVATNGREFCRTCGFGGAAPSAPTTDAPTDALAAIRARHERDERLTRWVRPDEMHADRAALLAEVERQQAVREQLTRQAMRLLEERDALAARLRGGATAPTPDPTADAAMLTEVATVRRLAQSRGYEGLYDLLGRIDRRLRQDTGGAYGE